MHPMPFTKDSGELDNFGFVCSHKLPGIVHSPRQDGVDATASCRTLPIEGGRLADPRLPADLRHPRPILTLLNNERLLRVRELRCLHRFRSSSPSQEMARKTLTRFDGILRKQTRSGALLHHSRNHPAMTSGDDFRRPTDEPRRCGGVADVGAGEQESGNHLR